MYASEPVSLALFLTGLALLMGTSVMLSRASEWTGVPVVLIFLALGVITSKQGVGHLAFHNYRLSFDFGTVALVLILFDGGLNTPFGKNARRYSARRSFWPRREWLATAGAGLAWGSAIRVLLGSRRCWWARSCRRQMRRRCC